MQTSVVTNSNHPLLLVFDEPKQQDIAMENFQLFLEILSKFKNQQILVLASFENSDTSFTDATNDIDFNLIRIENKLIHPIGDFTEN
jgi:ABC-type Mn2+/Zn2+ transport system ATPase subunit